VDGNTSAATPFSLHLAVTDQRVEAGQVFVSMLKEKSTSMIVTKILGMKRVH